MSSIDAETLAKYAMQELSVLAAGKDPKPGEKTDILARLNSMLDLWSISSILVPFRTQVSHTLDGSQSYTIGATGDITATRPTFIDSAFVTFQSVDYPVRVSRDRGEYDRIHIKDILGIPYMIYYEPSLPDGTIFIWYVGDSNYTLFLNTRGQLAQFADNTTNVDLAPGYEEAIYSNLAISIAPMFEVSVGAETAKKAKDSLSMIKRLNRQSPVMTYDIAIPSSNRHQYNINGDI